MTARAQTNIDARVGGRDGVHFQPICGREEARSQKNLPPFAAGHDSTAAAGLAGKGVDVLGTQGSHALR